MEKFRGISMFALHSWLNKYEFFFYNQQGVGCECSAKISKDNLKNSRKFSGNNHILALIALYH